MNPYAYLAAAVLILGAFGATYLYGHSAGADSVRLEWEQANKIQRQKEAQQAGIALENLEVNRAQDKVVFKTITKTVDKFVDRVEFRNVCFTPQFLCVANAAIGGESPAACNTAGPLPTSWEAGRRDIGVALTLDRGDLGILSGLHEEAPSAERGG